MVNSEDNADVKSSKTISAETLKTRNGSLGGFLAVGANRVVFQLKLQTKFAVARTKFLA